VRVDRLELAAPAKLNLRLLVGPAREDGYHPIRSLMVALEGLEDAVAVVAADRRSVRCAEADGPANLAWRALDALEARAGRPLPCAVTIDKRIPARAGLGGGSSDAAAVLVAADRLFGLGLGPAELEGIAAEVGSDVPFFVRGGAQWAEGRGERLAPAPMPGFAAVVVMPGFGLATGDVYTAFDGLPGPAPDDGRPVPGGMPELAGWVRNDLWPAARLLRPELAGIADELGRAGCRAALLCGSGAAVAGLVADRGEAERVRERLPFAATVVGPRPPLG
jgi:4-diphosphocytidyl-2-C-methyl-D-erythritol kinase